MLWPYGYSRGGKEQPEKSLRDWRTQNKYLLLLNRDGPLPKEKREPRCPKLPYPIGVGENQS